MKRRRTGSGRTRTELITSDVYPPPADSGVARRSGRRYAESVMTFQTVKLGGKSFVIVAEKDFRRLQERAAQTGAQDRGDVEESRRRMKERGGKTLAQVRKEMRL